MAEDNTTTENEQPSEEEKTGKEPRSSGGGSIFDNLDELRQRQDFDALVSTQRHLTSVPVGKPGKQTWFRVRPGEEWRIPASLLDWEDDGTQFYVHPHVAQELVTEVKWVEICVVVTTQGSLRLWPIRLPNPDGSDNPWFESARRVAEQAERGWVRMVANREAHGYDVFISTGDFGEPVWSEHSLGDLLKIAFSGKEIQSLDHPVVAKLLGRAQ